MLVARHSLRLARLALRVAPRLPRRPLSTASLSSPFRSPISPRPSSPLLSFVRPIRRFASSHPSPPPPTHPPTTWGRIKALGAPAIVIYLAVSLLDFSFVFLLVSAIGADRVRDAEDWVLDALEWRRKDGEPGKIQRAITHKVDDWKHREHHDEAVVPAPAVREPSKYGAVATTAVLAYAIHKTLLLPVRVGITVAITPRVVRLLQSWGWRVGVTPGAAIAASAGKATTA